MIQVIFVEDDDLYREAVEAELAEEGFAVRAFDDGEAMLAAVASGLTADVVLLDWQLESALGIDLLPQMRERGLLRPVVFLTGHSNAMYERLALQRGAVDFVDKARGTKILVERLRLAATRRPSLPSGNQEETFYCGCLELALHTSRAYWNKVDVGLTVAEFKTVRLLAVNVGSFITYREIYDGMRHVGFIAGSGEHGFRINVRSGIRRIREKFKLHHPDFSEIQTYPSFGYCWGEPQLASVSGGSRANGTSAKTKSLR